MKEISVCIVDDSKELRDALGEIISLAPGFTCTSSLGSAEEAIEIMPTLKVDLAMVDVSLPKMNGIQLVAYLHKNYPEIPCLVITGHLIPFYLERSFEAGARGYVLKDDVTGILEGVQSVLAGETYISKALRD